MLLSLLRIGGEHMDVGAYGAGFAAGGTIGSAHDLALGSMQGSGHSAPTRRRRCCLCSPWLLALRMDEAASPILTRGGSGKGAIAILAGYAISPRGESIFSSARGINEECLRGERDQCAWRLGRFPRALRSLRIKSRTFTKNACWRVVLVHILESLSTGKPSVRPQGDNDQKVGAWRGTIANRSSGMTRSIIPRPQSPSTKFVRRLRALSAGAA